MQTEIIAALLGMSGVLLGSLFGYLSQREAKKMQMMQRRIDRYRSEIRARIAVEEAAIAWLIESGVSGSPQVVKVKLRDRTEVSSGLRPVIPLSEVR